MFRTASLAALAATFVAGAASAQIALPTQPPQSTSNPVQEGAFLAVGQTASGNLAVKLDGGRQAPVQAQVSPDRTAPKGGPEVYARLPRDGNGLPTGVDVRLSNTNSDGKQAYQGVQLGKQ